MWKRIYLTMFVMGLGMLFFAGSAIAQLEPAQETEQPNPLTNLEELFNHNNPASFSGRRANLSNVPVQRVLNSQVMLVGPAKGRQLVVRTDQKLPRIQAGQSVSIGGILSQMPVTTQGWDLPGNASEALRGHQIFLNAVTVKIHGPSGGGQSPRR